jgi:outer membrane receptor protein involved in Fe transport
VPTKSETHLAFCCAGRVVSPKEKYVVKKSKKRECLLIILFLISITPAFAENTKYFDIPRLNADEALLKFGNQADVSVVYQLNLVKGYLANPLNGHYKIERAIQKLLKGTGLIAEFRGSSHLMIMKDDKRRAMKNRKTILTTTIAFLLNGGVQIGALAQEDSDEQLSAWTLEEIIVTASRRAVDVREVVGNVGVISGDTLESINASTFEDYMKLTPGVYYTKGSDAQSASVSIRGISTATGSSQTQQPVGIYLDETILTDFFGSISVPDITPYDLERVEILRGPQGTLYGSASLGGALRYITRKPDLNKNTASIGASFSSVESGDIDYVANMMGNTVLSDTFAIRGVVSFNHEGGYVDNIVPDVADTDWNNSDQLSARILTKWQPKDALSVMGMLFYQDVDLQGLSGSSSSTRYTEITTERWDNRFEYTLGSLNVEYDFDGVTLMLNSSYVEKERATLRTGPNSGTRRLIEGVETQFNLEQGSLASVVDDGYDDVWGNQRWVHELRLLSSSEGPIRWILGGNYAKVDTDSITHFRYYGIEQALNALIPSEGSNNYPEDVYFRARFPQEAKESSVYGEVEIDLGHQLSLTLGARQYWYESATDLALGGGAGYGPTSSLDVSQNGLMPKVSLAYGNSDDLLVYALYSEGYRLGGSNNLAATAPEAPHSFDSDSLKNYEFGIKAVWQDGRLITDVTVYHLDWTDIQLDGRFPSASLGFDVFATSNGGSAHSTGVEAALRINLSDSLVLNTAIAWTEAELDEDNDQFFIEKGNTLPGAREWQASNSLVYSFSVANSPADIVLSHQYGSETFGHINNLDKVDAYHLFDLHGSIKMLGNDLEIGLFVKNLSNEQAQYNVISPSRDPKVYTLSKPRTIGVSFNKQF